MLTRLATLAVRRRRTVLVAAALLFALAAAVGGGVAEELSSGGFEDPTAESTQANELVAEVFDAGDPNLVLLLQAKSGAVDDPTTAAAGAALTSELATTPGIDLAVSYWSL